MRVITGAVSHETSTFTPVATTWENYRERFGYLRGEEMLTAFRDTNTPIGGFIEGAEAHGFELIPTIFGQPHREFMVSTGIYQWLEGRRIVPAFHEIKQAYQDRR